MISLTPDKDGASGHFDYWKEIGARRAVPGGYVGKIFPIRKLVKSLKPSVVHGHYLPSGSLYCRWSGHKAKIAHSWGSDLFQDTQYFSKRILVRSAIRGSDVVIGSSDLELEVVRSYYPKARTHKMLLGVETNVFVPKPELKPEVFTFLSGRSSYPAYNILRILSAFETLKGTDSRLLLQRSRNPYPELEDAVNKSPAKDRIEWSPMRDHNKMPELYGQAHVTISIPKSDSSSATMMESMSCEVPVIASKIPANDEWDGMGIYIPKDDSVEALADLMRKVMEQPQLTRAYGKVAREIIIQRADWDKQMEGLVRLYEELLE
jgi:glycosyltransferase involved in cell wall biosynthesis